jgi:gas vesicle protein
MAKTRDKVLDRAGGAKPYIERALYDEDLRDNVRNAFESAREVYNELLGGRGAIPVATRVATDKDIQDQLKDALEQLREAADRVQGNKDHGARNTMLLLTGIALGILFNPMSGAQTRKWVSDKLFGPSDDFTYQGGNSHSTPSSN